MGHRSLDTLARRTMMLVLTFLAATAPQLRGDEPSKAVVPALKQEIVVTPERGAAERDEVAASVTVLTREHLEMLPAQSLAEVVNIIPGITMFFDGATAGAPMVTARGFFGGGEVEYVKLLVDGMPAGDVESGLIDLGPIPVTGIQPAAELLRA